MSTITHDIVAKLWNLCNVLKDDGVTYHQYVTELTYLLFLKMAKETNTESQLPDGYRWDDLEAKSAYLADGIARAAKDAGYPLYSTRVGSMVCAFFSKGEVRDWDTAALCNTQAFAKYFRSMLEQGIYLAPSQFETAFVSIAHSEDDIERTIAAASKAFKSL